MKQKLETRLQTLFQLDVDGRSEEFQNYHNYLSSIYGHRKLTANWLGYQLEQIKQGGLSYNEPRK